MVILLRPRFVPDNLDFAAFESEHLDFSLLTGVSQVNFFLLIDFVLDDFLVTGSPKSKF